MKVKKLIHILTIFVIFILFFSACDDGNFNPSLQGNSVYYGTWISTGTNTMSRIITENSIIVTNSNTGTSNYTIISWMPLQNAQTIGNGNNTDYPSGYKLIVNLNGANGEDSDVATFFVVFLHTNGQSIVANRNIDIPSISPAVFIKQ
jgi:hypothetical protein